MSVNLLNLHTTSESGTMVTQRGQQRNNAVCSQERAAAARPTLCTFPASAVSHTCMQVESVRISKPYKMTKVSFRAEAKGTTAMLFCFEEGDAKDYIIRRRAQGPRRDLDLGRSSQVLGGGASGDLIAEASYFVFKSLFYGEPVQVLEKRFGVFCSTRFKDSSDSSTNSNSFLN